MKRIKQWIISMAPVWAKECLQAENAKLRKENERLKAKNEALSAYIEGLENGIRAQRRIVIQTGGNKE